MSAASSLRVATFLSRRAITRGNRGITVLTVLMMAVIYAELMFVPSLIQGATNQIQLELRQYVSGSIALTPSPHQLSIHDATAVLARVRATSGVSAATATTLVGSQISHAGRTNSWPVLAIDPASYRATFATSRTMIEGSFLTPGANDQIVLGVAIAGAGRTRVSTYASSLQNVHVGDLVAVTLSGGREHTFRVQGIYQTALTEANASAFVNRATIQRLVPALGDDASTIFVRTAHTGDESSVIARLRVAAPGLGLQSWETLAASVKDLTGSFDTIKSILNGVSLVVAAIAVFIVTYVDLVNKRRTIGIERALGISATAITLNYLLKAVVFAVLGVALGTLLFNGVAVPAVLHHPFNFPIGPVTLSPPAGERRVDALILLAVALVGALVPAWRAVRLRILDAVLR